MASDRISFTIVGEDGEETRLDLGYNTDSDRVIMSLKRPVSIDRQQLAELGHLFIELAERGEWQVDQDDVDELISGYDFPWS